MSLVLSKDSENETWKNLLWWGGLQSIIFTFALSFMEVWEYNRWSQMFNSFKLIV
jgi:hypothetical protein